MKDEQVAVFPDTALEHFEGLPGFSSATINFEQFNMSLDMCMSFKPRNSVEFDPRWKQIIPYTYIHTPITRKILVYRRADKGGDPRLAGKWSIGFGGHINPLDDRQGRARMLDIATNRELQEELTFYVPYDSPETVGFLYRDETPVDRVHLGVVRKAQYVGMLSDVQHSDEIAELRWATPRELLAYKLEGWSELLVQIIQKVCC
jgi:predicted NUDIX family phosphoesterase